MRTRSHPHKYFVCLFVYLACCLEAENADSILHSVLFQTHYVSLGLRNVYTKCR